MAALASSAATPARRPTPPPAADRLQRFAEARLAGEAFRTRLQAIARAARDDPAGAAERADALRAERPAYFGLRETLFELAFLHASAVVERRPALDRGLLLRASLALMAGTELVSNFHALAAVLGEAGALRAAWNEADPARGVPEWSFEVSLATYRNAEYQELFRAALARLSVHRADLDALEATRDPSLRLVYPRGVEAGLREAERAHALLRAGLAEEDLSEDTRALRALVERSRTLRSEWGAAAPILREAIARDGGLVRGDVHVRVHGIKRDYLAEREALYRLAVRHLPKLTRDDIPYAPDFRLRAVAVSLLAGVTLFENARLIQTAVVPVPGVRPLLNQADPSLGLSRGFWERTERELYRIEYRSYLEAGARLMEAAHPPAYDPHPEAEDPVLAYVGRELSTAAALGEIRGERPPRQIARVLRHYARQVTALGAGLPQQGQRHLSQGFGNFVGLVALRRGKLHGQPEWTRFVRARLRPGDLLLEKTPFRLTDTFIPGHFGHVAMHVGTEAELRALGLLDHPFIRPYRRAIEEGRTIVEALRNGTQINTLERFLDVDDLAILRPKPDRVPAAEVRQAVLLAFAHVGKKYDFAFDANTWDAIVCSELAFQSYVRVPWSIGKVLGSYTISPDDVAVQAGADPARPFDLVTLVHDGRLVHDRVLGLEDESLYRGLVERRRGADAGAARPVPRLPTEPR
jgi:hypothetical protein